MPDSLRRIPRHDLQFSFSSSDKRALIGMAVVLIIVTVATLAIAAWPQAVAAEPLPALEYFAEQWT